MECLRCGKEIRGDSQFCIYCGQKVSQCGYDQETQKLAEKLADLEKEQAELEKKKQETLQEEQDLNLKLDNYTRLQKESMQDAANGGLSQPQPEKFSSGKQKRLRKGQILKSFFWH